MFRLNFSTLLDIHTFSFLLIVFWFAIQSSFFPSFTPPVMLNTFKCVMLRFIFCFYLLWLYVGPCNLVTLTWCPFSCFIELSCVCLYQELVLISNSYICLNLICTMAKCVVLIDVDLPSLFFFVSLYSYILVLFQLKVNQQMIQAETNQQLQ